jgi:uncharacterized membrane protein
VNGNRCLRLFAKLISTRVPLSSNKLNRASFAVAAAGVAGLSIAYGDFALMRHSVFAHLAQREMWVRASALVLFAASIGLCSSRWALISVLLIGTYLLAWLVTSIGPIFHQPLSIGSWYGCTEAATSLAGATILYAMLRSPLQGSGKLAAGGRMVHAAQVLFGLTCVFYGLSHFVYADYTASLVPAWLPSGLAFAYFTGLGHIGAGIGVMVGTLARLAATLEAIMMSLFGFLVWVPSFFAQPRPTWAGPPQNQWSELVVNLVLAASAWIVADSLRSRHWFLKARSRD